MAKIPKFIWIKNQRYWLYDTYDERWKAHVQGQRMKKKNSKCKYFIAEHKVGSFYPVTRYGLFMNKVFKIW